MAIKFSEMGPANALDGTELVAVSQEVSPGVLDSRKSTLGEIKSFVLTPSFIDGMVPEWVSSDSLQFTTGAAFIESQGGVLVSNSNIVKSSLSLSADTWYHMYFYINSGSPDVEVSTSAPASPYFSSARSKTGDGSRRYLGSARTNASGELLNFLCVGSRVNYRNDQGFSPFRILTAGQATVDTPVDASNVIPITSRLGSIRIINISDVSARTGTSDDSATDGIVAVDAGGNAFVQHPLDSSQSLTYYMTSSPSSEGLYIDVYGYKYSR